MKNSITLEVKVIRKVTIIAFWIGLWEVFSIIIGNGILLPSPFEVVKSLSFLIKKEYFWKSILGTLIRVISGVSISIVLGICLGIFAGVISFIEEFLQPVVVSIKATPVMSIIIIALVWFTSSNVVIFTAILICFPIVYTNVLEGVKSVDENLIQMAKLYKVKKRYILKDIYIPQLSNYIISGIFMCMGIGWKVSVASEVLSTPKYSIGINILNDKSMLETSELFAWTVVVILLSFIFEGLFKCFINMLKKKY